jgi:hypothetical protein
MEVDDLPTKRLNSPIATDKPATPANKVEP